MSSNTILNHNLRKGTVPASVWQSSLTPKLLHTNMYLFMDHLSVFKILDVCTWTWSCGSPNLRRVIYHTSPVGIDASGDCHPDHEARWCANIHAKIILGYTKETKPPTVFVGSFNLTAPTLQDIMIQLPKRDAQDMTDRFNRMWEALA